LPRFNSEGTESALATNLVGFYGLTDSLLPILKNSEDPRVVNVVSAGMFAAKLHIPTIERGLSREDSEADRENYSGISLYAQHHRGRVMLTDFFAAEAARSEAEGSKVKVNSVHPGWVDTPGLAGAKDMEGFYKGIGSFLRTEEEGADTVVWLACTPGLQHTGKYFFDRASRKKHKCLSGTKSNVEDLQRLVDLCKRGFSSAASA